MIYFRQSTQVETTESKHLFDDPKYRLDPKQLVAIIAQVLRSYEPCI